jgi:hypothetical protein
MDKSKFNDRKEWRKFGFGLAILTAAVAVIQAFKGHTAVLPYTAAIGLAFAAAGQLVPVLLKPLYVGMAYVGEGLGWFSTRVILTVLFFVLVTPIGTVLRLFGKKFMPDKADAKAPSYWIDRQKSYDQKDGFENQF